MKKTIRSIMPYLALSSFLLYWLGVIILLLPANYAKSVIAGNAPRFKTMFGVSWKLFTPPGTYNNRLYFIVKDAGLSGTTDTIEVLKKLSDQKQARAPFNQQENIMDHLVNNNVEGLIKIIWHDKKVPGALPQGITDSSFISHEIAQAENNKNYKACFTTLKNYGRIVLKENKINSAGKELKFIITEKMIRPFKQMNDPNVLPKEVLVFETPYMPADQW